ncbi:MAG: phosphatidylglycerol lysyltransferase domain-containing protein [Lachnospiraceae bacterium]|nr:phosphatidylglycerol lysyltransferase domain-containing protein [Lachnospiraceae bacterium]
MKTAYIGIDILYPALPALFHTGVEILKIFTCRTDNVTEFNLRVCHFARVHGIPLQQDRVRREDLEALRDQGCELVVCAGYYHIIPCIDGLKMVNVHPALLPLGRGAWPMPLTILKGLTESGMTIHRLTPELDAGDILLQERIEVFPDRDDLQTLTQRQNALLSGMIEQLVLHLDDLWDHARPQGPDFAYWDNPDEADWTVRSSMTFPEADRILRAFYTYACVFENGKKRYELTGGRAFPDASSVPEGTEGRRFPLADGAVIVAPQVRELKAAADHRDPASEPVSMEQKAEIDRIYGSYGHGDSAHSFPSLLMWKDDMDLTVHLEEDLYAVRCGWKGANSWFFPCGSPEAKRAFIGALLRTEDPSFCYMTEEDRDFLSEEFPEAFAMEETPEDSEYLYDRREMTEMKGGLYAKSRSFIHKLEREHTLHSEAISEANFREAMEISSEWVRHSEEVSRVMDDHASNNLFAHWDACHAGGVIAYVDGEPMAVAGGYPLTEDSFDCCIQKAKINLRGLADYLRAAFANNAPEGVRILNWEEDLGLQGLREMKQLMRPCGMITMYRGIRKT